MGILGFLGQLFLGAYNQGSQKQQGYKSEKPKEEQVVYLRDILYPGELPSFAELDAEEHQDIRALVYAIRSIDPNRKWPFTAGSFDTGDFGSKAKGARALLKSGLVKEAPKEKVLVFNYQRYELQKMARSMGLAAQGNKDDIAKRLVEAGIKLDRSRCKKMYELTAAAVSLREKEQQDIETAIKKATMALKVEDYDGAMRAYREYDDVWGFVHSSGKNHTIFANYDIPPEWFEALEKYSMYGELINSVDFMKTLRACLIAGLMRGTQDKGALAWAFGLVCDEVLICPDLMDYYRYGTDEDDENGENNDENGENDEMEAVFNSMEENILSDDRYAMEYYIAHVMYKIRRYKKF